MDKAPIVELLVSAPINQITKIIVMIPNKILQEELQFDIETILSEMFDRELDLFYRRGPDEVELLFIPQKPLQAMLVPDIYPTCVALKEWLEKRLSIETEVFLSFEETPPEEVLLAEKTQKHKRLMSFVDRIMQPRK